ncbi:ExeM/NucH family extracellular endonuclease [Larsenimonas salina]|uniref:ExeM/NucH family extracellular endonuclease n=1 Tax=Larsenimonas salina TaxID=1295565 RepID=UPI0020741431|nr:ExeM/NucH family extracellular endonuclease [Larsenimonas salina]MCM5704550.1 ExeM/NucH family extracellular endonuclease [Larsenimonas salina]
MLSLSPFARPWSLSEDSFWTGTPQGFLSGTFAPVIDRLIERFSQWRDDVAAQVDTALDALKQRFNYGEGDADDADTPAEETPGAPDSDGDSTMSGGLLITEYVEGSGYTKALELTNTGAQALSLADFTLSLYSNGASTPTNTQPLGEFGTLAAGDSLVLSSAQAGDELLALSDGTSSVINFNGNDALVLEGPGGEVLDTLGTVGSDAEFGADITLRRDPSITTGSAEFDPEQWQPAPANALDDLGTFSGVEAPEDDGSGGDTGGSDSGNSDSGDNGAEGGSGEPIEGITRISTVQGEGMSSDLVGREVTVDAIVTLDSQNGMSGFFIQEQDADRDDNPATSEGLFIYAPDAAEVAVGDRVQVTGTVEQYEGRTELSDITGLEVLARDQDLPDITELTLPIADKNTLAAFEGMRVAVSADDEAPLTVTDTYELGRYGTVTLASGGRLEQYTETHTPDQAGYQQWLDEVEQRSIVLDDASNAQNPETVLFGRDGAPLSAENTLRGGDTLETATGVLDFNQQQWRVQSTEGQDFQATNARTDAPDTSALGDASLKVASFNVLNYFTTLDEGGATVTTPAGTEHDPRGADSALELARQQAKLVEAINATDADVVGLMELENDGYADDSSIATLVDALNADAPGANWAYITPRDDEGAVVAPGSDAIAVGMIYKTDAVTPEGEAAVNTDGVFDAGNRAPLLQSFTETASGETFSVVVNHFKSKGSVIDGQDAIGDGQGNNNPIRVEAAEQLAEWLATDPTGSGDSDTLIIGDLNSYAMEDPITALESAGFSLLDDDYSYSYDGQWGSLDHALASQTLADQVTGTTTWHINADEPYALDYNTEYKSDAQQSALYSDAAYRASDHDPVIVGLNLGGQDAPLLE